MNRVLKLTTAFLLSGFLFVACDKDDDEKAVLKIADIVVENHDGGMDVKRGGTLSVNFTAIAGENARLDYYHIEIHDHPESGNADDEYRIIDDSFKDKTTFKGLKNAKVHQHVSVPQDANLGKYHVVIVVVDDAGNSVDTEDLDFEVVVIE